jgi:hypothetical protein
MSVGCHFDEYKDCAVVAASNFGRESDIIEGLDQLRELSFGFCFSWTKALARQESVLTLCTVPVVANR